MTSQMTRYLIPGKFIQGPWPYDPNNVNDYPPPGIKAWRVMVSNDQQNKSIRKEMTTIAICIILCAQNNW